MTLTPTNVSLGGERGVVAFAATNGKPFTVTMDNAEAKWFIDHLNTPLLVTFSVPQPAAAKKEG